MKKLGFVWLVVILLSIFSFQRSTVWKSNASLWEDTIQKSPWSSIAHSNLGLEYMRSKKVEAALLKFERAAELGRTNGTAHLALNNLGIIYSSREFPQLRDLKKAEYYLIESVRAAPTEADTFSNRYNLALVLIEDNRVKEAFAVLKSLENSVAASKDKRHESILVLTRRALSALEQGEIR